MKCVQVLAASNRHFRIVFSLPQFCRRYPFYESRFARARCDNRVLLVKALDAPDSITNLALEPKLQSKFSAQCVVTASNAQ